MKSNEILKETFKEQGVKFVAQELKLSSSLVYKWCHDKGSETSPGAENPLDRIQAIVECTGNPLPIQWLCQINGGYSEWPDSMGYQISSNLNTKDEREW